MFVRTLDQLAGTDKEVKWQDGDLWLKAVRLVTRDDGAGFSLADVTLSAGWADRLPTTRTMWRQVS